MTVYLICGTRRKSTGFQFVNYILSNHVKKDDVLISGMCPDSADIHAKEYADMNKITFRGFPSHPKQYLQRNISMIRQCDVVIAFWDGFSYGTAHTIATAVQQNKKVIIERVI